MVLGIASLIIGLVGFSFAGIRDLQTTEFPDWIPYSLIASALVMRSYFALEGNFTPLITSAIVGLAFLGFGFLLYYTKQWGDGDAWLMGTMGFLYPEGLEFAAGVFPFPIMMILNFFMVAFFYIVAYSIIIGFRSNKTKKFVKDFKRSFIRILGITIAFSIALAGFLSYMNLHELNMLLIFPVVLFALLVFMNYGKFIEKNLFKKKISVNDLRIGDVPVGGKWRVLSESEVKSLKKRGGSVWIKEGVRFAPVFALTIIVMYFFGNIWSFIL